MAPTRTRRTSLPSSTRRSPIKTRRSSLTPARSTRGRSKSVITITPKPTSTTKRRPPPLKHTFKGTILSDDENESGLDSPDPLNIVPRASPLKTPKPTVTPTPTSSRRTQFEIQPQRVDAEAPFARVTGERPVSRRPTTSGPRSSEAQQDNAVAGPSRPTSIPSQKEPLGHGAGPADAPARPSRSVLSSSSAMPSRQTHDSIIASAGADPSRPLKRQRSGPSSQPEHSSPQTPIDSSARGYSAATPASAGFGKGKSPALLPAARLAPEQAIKNRPSRIRRAAGGGAEGIRDIEQMIVDWLNSYRNVSSTPPDSTIIHLTTLPLSYLDPPAQLVPDGGAAHPPLSTPSRGAAGMPDITPSPRTAEKAFPAALPESRVRVPGWRVVRLGEDDEEDARLEMLSGSTKSPRKTRHAHLEEDDADEVYIARHRKHELFERSLWLREKEALKFDRHKLRSRLDSLRSMSLHTWRAILAPVLARPDTDLWADGRAKVQSQGEDWLKDELVRNATKDLQRYDELLPNDGKKRKDRRDGLVRTATPPSIHLPDETDEEEANIDYSAPARKVSQRRADRNGTSDLVTGREHSTGPAERPINRRADKGMSLKLHPYRSSRSEITVVAPSDDNDSLTPDAPTTRSSRTLLTPSSAAIFLSPAGSSPLTPLTDPKASLQPSPLPLDHGRRAITVVHDAPPPNSTKILLPAPPIRDVSPTRASDRESLPPRSLRTAVVDNSDRTAKMWPRPRNTILSSSGPVEPTKTVRDLIPSRPFHDRRQSKDLSKHPLTPVMITRAEAREMKEVEAAVVI